MWGEGRLQAMQQTSTTHPVNDPVVEQVAGRAQATGSRGPLQARAGGAGKERLVLGDNVEDVSTAQLNRFAEKAVRVCRR